MSGIKRCHSCMSEMEGAPACPSCGWQINTVICTSLYLPAEYILNNRYLIGKVLGTGGFGIVYIAWDTNLDIRVAVKEFLPKEYAARSDDHVSIAPYTGNANEEYSIGLAKFLEEAKALARFQDHPGIVTVHESFRANNTAYMVMQYLDGETLKEYLKSQPGEKIPFNIAVKAMTFIMDALREVHNAGFVHRDISPDNIFITTQNQVKLLDFGSARYAIGEHSKSLTSVLKHGYAPVEQYSSKGNQGPWSDVYAVCATIYRCVTGFVPLDAMERVQGEVIKSPKQLGIDIPVAGERAIMRGLALKAVDRFESILQLQQSLASEGQVDSRVGLTRAITDAESLLKMGHGDVVQPQRPALKRVVKCTECGAKNHFNHEDEPRDFLCGKCKKVLEKVIRCPKCGARNHCNPGDDPKALLCGNCKLDLEILGGPIYFSVSPLKLIVMSLCTFSIYEIYWFYKNWTIIKEHEQLKINPFWRAFFSIFFCYSCFKKIRGTAESSNLRASIAAGPLAAGWSIVTLFYKLPDPYWLISLSAVIFLVPVQILVHKINATLSPACGENNRFTAWNITGVVFGIIWCIFILIGSFAPTG